MSPFWLARANNGVRASTRDQKRSREIGWRKQIRSCEQNGSCKQSGSCEQNGSREQV
jgi:G:T-mismatch repair DNA endonuclease (very short patch repair protein)